MLTTGLLAESLSEITAIISPTALSFQDLSLGTVGVYAIYTKDYFPQGGFENQKENVTFTKYLLDVLLKGFKNDEQIELFTEDNKLYAVGAKDRYEDIIPDVEVKQFPVAMKRCQYGIVPEKIDLEKALVAKFAVDELSFMKADEYHFDCDGKEIKVRTEFSDTSAYTKTLSPLKVVNTPKMSALFSAELFDSAIKPLTGEVWTIIDTDAMAVTKKEKTFSITMMVAGKESV